MKHPAVIYIVVVALFSAGLFWKADTNAHQNTEKVQAAAYAGCLRGNVLRSVVGEFLLSAIRARKATGTKTDLVAARHYRLLAAELSVAAVYGLGVSPHYGQFKVPCDLAFPKP